LALFAAFARMSFTMSIPATIIWAIASSSVAVAVSAAASATICAARALCAAVTFAAMAVTALVVVPMAVALSVQGVTLDWKNSIFPTLLCGVSPMTGPP
jgi:hypothetical protein